MNRTSRRKEEPDRISNEGTAARTRPFSFEEIMSWRKKKLTMETNSYNTVSKESSWNVDNYKVSSHLELEGSYKNKKELKRSSKEAFRKEGVKSKRDEDSLKGRDKGALSSEKYISSKNRREKESTSGKHCEIKLRSDDPSRAVSRRESHRKWQSEILEKDRRKERDGISRKETERKSHGHDDDVKRRSEIDRPSYMKHDSGRWEDLEYSVRNDRRREHSRTYYEEPKSKRRRSISREHDRERDKRSVSSSPGAHKRTYHGHDYEECDYSKDNSRRKYPKGDSHRTNGNGYGSGQYQRRGSVLGGYSPRKKKTEITVRSPSPIVHSPERKTVTWDQPPAGANHASFGSVVSTFESPANKKSEMASSFPVTPVTTKLIPVPSFETILAAKSTSVDSVQLTQATRPLRRLYIESLPDSASDKMVIDCLNDFLLSSGVNHIEGTKPCISCIINNEKHQALVEFLTPEDASAALSFDGRTLSGSVLKMRRPKDYVETTTAATAKQVEEAKVISDFVKDSPHKIFVAGISGAISPEMLMEIVGVFGPLAAYRFEYNEELGGPCAFLEYVDHSIALKVCAGLNGMKLGGCILMAVQALPAAAAEEGTIETPPFYGVPMHAKPLLADPTKVLQLQNVFDREEFLLLSRSEMEEILEDIRLECGRFGTVKSINFTSYTSISDAASEAILVDRKDESSAKMTPITEGTVDDIQEDATDGNRMLIEDPERKGYSESHPSDRPTVGEPFLSEESSDSPHIDMDDGGADVGAEVSEPGVIEMPRKEDSPIIQSGDDEAEKSKGDDSGCVVAEDDHLGLGIDAFEPGLVLIEFVREEATCLAACSLHLRMYGERVVTAGYAPYDLYRARFPR